MTMSPYEYKIHEWHVTPKQQLPSAYIHFKIKTKSKQWNTLLRDSSFRFKIPLLCLLCLATVSLDLEPELTSMQNIYRRG